MIPPNTELKVFFEETNLESRISSPKTVIQSYKSAFNPINISKYNMSKRKISIAKN